MLSLLLNEKPKKEKTENKGIYQGIDEAVYRINQYFIPILQRAESPLEVQFRIIEKVRCKYPLGEYKEWNGTDARFRKNKSGILCEVFPRNNIEKNLLIQVAVRNGRTDIANYPRFHMPSDIESKDELWNFLSYMHVYFCILTIDEKTKKPAFFRLNRFDSIPKENFKLISRGKGRRKDRLVPCGKSADTQRNLRSIGKKGTNLNNAIQQAINQKY